jgi:hypothetical protein
MFIVLIIVSILTAGYALRAVLRAAATLIRRQRGDQIEHELESAEPLSGNRMSDLATLRLIAQPVTSKTSTPMGLHWNGRATNPASKYAGNGGKTPHLPAQLTRQHRQLARLNRRPQRRLVVYSSEHDGLDPV